MQACHGSEESPALSSESPCLLGDKAVGCPTCMWCFRSPGACSMCSCCLSAAVTPASCGLQRDWQTFSATDTVLPKRFLLLHSCQHFTLVVCYTTCTHNHAAALTTQIRPLRVSVLWWVVGDSLTLLPSSPDAFRHLQQQQQQQSAYRNNDLRSTPHPWPLAQTQCAGMASPTLLLATVFQVRRGY
jgi:hypothetical protein